MLDLDIIGICESWLVEDEVISVDEYKWYGHNRVDLSSRAVRGSGGVGVLIKKSVLSMYVVEVIDKSVDGILWILLKPRWAGEELGICVCYFPPESSSRGDASQEFFDVLASQLFKFGSGRGVFVCGDFNARCGNLSDCEVGDIVSRCGIDEVVNKFGELLVGFLKDTGMCMVNGRGSSVLDNLTSVSTKGRAVVDYCITTWNDLNRLVDFRVFLVSQLCEMVEYQGDVKLPDHSLLSWLWEVDVVLDGQMEEVRG